jgi:alpha-L-rhamnosidase
MLTSCDLHSWCHMLSVNATATMEAWSRAEKPNLSWSHPWATAPAVAIVRGFMGLTVLTPTFTQWQLKPQPGNVSWAQIRVPSAAGLFHVSFNQTEGGFLVVIAPPANTMGRVCLPQLGVASSVVLVVDGVRVNGTAMRDYVCASGLVVQKGNAEIIVARPTSHVHPRVEKVKAWHSSLYV